MTDLNEKFYYLSISELNSFLSGLSNENGGFIIFLPEREINSISKIQETFNKFKKPFFGAVFPEVIVEGEFKNTGILLLYQPVMPQYFFTEDLSLFSGKETSYMDSSVKKLSALVNEKSSQTLFMIFDAMLLNISSALESVYFNFFDKIRYMGANAGSESFKSMDCLFDNHSLRKNCAIMAILNDHPGGLMEHGYEIPRTTVTATSTTSNRINSIEWKPAFEVYKEIVKKNYDIEVTAENLYSYGAHFPFAIVRADKTLVVRVPVGLESDGSLFCVGEIPPASLLTLLELPGVENTRAMDLLWASLRSNLKNGDPLLLFYCAGRRMHLGQDSLKEIRYLEDKIPQNKVFGALSLGELGSSQGVNFPLFQNSTILCSLV